MEASRWGVESSIDPDFDLVGLEPLAGIDLEIGTPVLLPVDRQHWLDRTLSGSGATQLLGRGTIETLDGWHVFVIRSDMTDGDRTVERVHALFEIDEYGVVVVATGSEGMLDASRDSLIALFRHAKPRYHQKVVALAQVWDGVLEVVP